MPLTEDRMTGHQDSELLSSGVAASTKIFGGGLTAVNAAGYALPAADAAGLKVVGISEEQVDNTAGANGAKNVLTRRKKSFWLKNSSGNPVTIAHLQTDVYVEDDETVSSSGGVNNIVAGKCLAVSSRGVLVEIS
ncbi:hypothetical protein [Desulfopila inferna]|uniref:hypothetical protein n=1 Tax=Desulfopila inferna TaxID=468528 RepID=UPI001966A1DA|nr:hypothetical protein [Desulfopila inferna]MBM9605963.1 hypothetical protein [Desulfopila inferna]